MAAKKIKLSDIKVKSFITELDDEAQKNIIGGYVPIIGSKKTNWTYADTRADLYQQNIELIGSAKKTQG